MGGSVPPPPPLIIYEAKFNEGDKKEGQEEKPKPKVVKEEISVEEQINRAKAKLKKKGTSKIPEEEAKKVEKNDPGDFRQQLLLSVNKFRNNKKEKENEKKEEKVTEEKEEKSEKKGNKLEVVEEKVNEEEEKGKEKEEKKDDKMDNNKIGKNSISVNSNDSVAEEKVGKSVENKNTISSENKEENNENKNTITLSNNDSNNPSEVNKTFKKGPSMEEELLMKKNNLVKKINVPVKDESKENKVEPTSNKKINMMDILRRQITIRYENLHQNSESSSETDSF